MTHTKNKSNDTVATVRTSRRPFVHLIGFGEQEKSDQRCSSKYQRRFATQTQMVVKLIEEERWETLTSYLSREQSSVVENQGKQPPAKTPNAGSWNSIHFACAFNAPLDVIRKLVQSYGEGLREVDERRRTPLHIATAFGASPGVVQFLLSQYSDAASMPDIDGRYALHLACQKRKLTSNNVLSNRNDQGCWGWTCAATGEGSIDYEDCYDFFDEDEECADDVYGEPLDTLFCSRINESRFYRQRVIERYCYDGPNLETIDALCNASPLTIGEEDNAGYTALEYAIHSSVRQSVVLELQEATSRSNKMKKQGSSI